MNRFYPGRALAVAGTVAALCLLPALPASASAIVYNGGTFGVEASAVDANTVDYLYTADFTDPGWNPLGYYDYITSVALKLSNGGKIASIDAFSTSAPGGWVPVIGGLSANDCMENPNNGFACAEDSLFVNGNAALTQGSYNWHFTVSYVDDVDPADFLDPYNHIKAHFESCATDSGDTCQHAGNISEDVDFAPYLPPDNPDPPRLPAPGALWLLLAGLPGLAWRRRRNRR